MTPHTPAERSCRISVLCCVLFAMASLGCGVPAPDGPADTYGLDFSLPPDARTDGAIIFVVDGVNAEIFEQMLTDGELPAIEKYFVDRGLYVRRAVANTPSVTLANETSLVTGLFPGHHGITGINWFDRNRLLWRNYETIAQKNTLDDDHTATTIYERFPDRTTFSVFHQAHRGATKFVENWTSAGAPFFFGWYEFMDRLTLHRLNIVTHVARTRKEMPVVTVVYLLAPDFRAYAEGVSSEAYREAMRHTDYQIGRVLADVERAGLLDDVHLALVSDHSLCDVRRHRPLEEFLRNEVGLDVAEKRLWEETAFEKRLDYYRNYQAVCYRSGDRYQAICLRRPLRDADGEVTGYAGWLQRPTAEDLHNYPAAEGFVDLPQVLLNEPAVDAVAYSSGENRAVVITSRGSVEFRQPDGPGGDVSYHLLEGQDPFGWAGHVPSEALDGEAMTPRQWLDATWDTEYPDLPAPIVAYFRARRAGDLAVFAAPDWDFTTGKQAGHGGLRPGDMYVPLLLTGPGVPTEGIDTARTVDLVPTLLELLGRPLPNGLDGESLVRPAPAGDSEQPRRTLPAAE
ncbi:MAG: alkaline phosphatase family protein [Phycisphaerae bacterium]